MKDVLTLTERINRLISDCIEKGQVQREELKKGIFKLVERATHPEYFCPKCDEKMFYEIDKGGFNCLNCGYKSTDEPLPQTKQIPVKPSKTGKVPPQVEKVIQQAQQDTKRIPRQTKIGDKIRKLRDQIDGGGAPPSALDTARLKNVDPNIKDVNWV